MKSFIAYLFREEGGVLYKEAHVALHHLVPPQFKMHEGASLSQEQALSLLEIAGKGASGERLRVDLLTCSEVPPHPAAAISQAPETP